MLCAADCGGGSRGWAGSAWTEDTAVCFLASARGTSRDSASGLQVPPVGRGCGSGDPVVAWWCREADWAAAMYQPQSCILTFGTFVLHPKQSVRRKVFPAVSETVLSLKSVPPCSPAPPALILFTQFIFPPRPSRMDSRCERGLPGRPGMENPPCTGGRVSSCGRHRPVLLARAGTCVAPWAQKWLSGESSLWPWEPLFL